MLLRLIFLFFGFDGDVCMATTFAQEGDKWLGGDSPYLKRAITPNDIGVAHREFPMGGMVRITNLLTGKETDARVIDRGPFGRLDSKGRWYNGVKVFRRAIRSGKAIPRDGWRGCLDMTPRVARRIGSTGFDPVFVRTINETNSIRRRLPRRQPQKVRRKRRRQPQS